MKSFLALIGCTLAGIILIAGCDEDDPRPPEPWVRRSCDAIVISENDQVIAAVNSSGTLGHVRPYGSLDDQPSVAPPDWSAMLWRYDGQGHRQSGTDFWNDDPYAMHEVRGIRPLPGTRWLIVGPGNWEDGLVSAVVDSSLHYERAQYWSDVVPDWELVCAPAGDGLACLYTDVAPGVWYRLAFLDADGVLRFNPEVVDASTSYPPPKLAGLSSGNVVVIDQSIVSEYSPMSPDPEWVFNSPSRRFEAAGEDINGNLTIFGTFVADSLSNQLAVVTRIADTLQYRTCFIAGGAIEDVSVAARSADSTWLIACVTNPSRDFCVLRYDGTDTVRVVDNWMPEGDPRANCAASGSNGWVVFGGHVDHPGYRRDAFLRAYTSAGLPTWSDVLNGE